MSCLPAGAPGFARQLAIALTLIVLLLPFLWLLQMSFKSNDVILQFPPPLIFTPTLANYASLWQSAFSASFVNSLLSASFSTAFALLFGVPAAYALSRWAGRGKRALSFAILVTRMAPPIAFTIPFFLFYRWIGLLDTVTGLVLIYTSFNLPLVIWMMQPFFETVPRLAGRSRAGRRRADPHRVPRDRVADGRARHRRHRDPLLSLRLERFLLRADPDPHQRADGTGRRRQFHELRGLGVG